jgi:hypothetical protein
MIAFLAPLPGAATTQKFSQESFVYIECYDSSNGPVSTGSGVIVSSDGRVLTAKHVVRSDSCRASLGTGATVPSRRLSRGRASSAYDAIIMRLVPEPNEVFDAVSYARIANLQGKPITAYGVPVDGTGQVSVRRGVVSTTVPDNAGHLETDALTARGMSGGPVILDETGALVGIVVGADLDVTTGLPTNFAVLAVQEVATELELSLDSDRGPPLSSRARILTPNWRDGSWFGIRSDADLKTINEATPAILAACASCIRFSGSPSSTGGVMSNEGLFMTLDATACKDGVRLLLASNRYYPPPPSAPPGTIGGVGRDRQFVTVDVHAGEVVKIALDGTVNFTGWPRMCLAD